MSKSEPTWTACGNCDRGGRGHASDKCACGWKITEVNNLGCYAGTPIEGEPVRLPKLSRSKQRYQHYLNVADCFESFRHFLAADTEQRRTA